MRDRKKEIREKTIDEISFILSEYEKRRYYYMDKTIEENIRNIITDYVVRMDSALKG